jgi:hypothetical protein
MRYLKRIMVVMALGFSGAMVGLFLALPTQAEPVLGHISGFPIYPGLAEVEDAGVIFDKAEGRVVEALLRGEGDVDEVRSFYRAALAQTGWRRVMTPCAGDQLVFVREDEILEMAISGADGTLEINIHLAPGGAGQ